MIVNNISYYQQNTTHQTFSSKLKVCRTRNAFTINNLINKFNDSSIILEDLSLKYSDLPMYIVQKISNKLLPIFIALDNNCIVQIIKSKMKTIAGYCLTCNKKDKTGYIEFLILDKKVRNKKKGYDALLMMAKSISKTAENKGLKSIQWRVSSDNKKALNLFNKFKPQIKNENNGYFFENCSLEDFSKTVDRYNQK